MGNEKKSLKDKLYFYFAEKNWGVRREYGPYVDAHREEHKKFRIKHWWILFRLNFHYRILRRKSYMLKFSKELEAVRTSAQLKKSSTPPVNYLTKKDFIFYRFSLIYGIWNSVGVTDELINTLKLWEQSKWSWKNDNPQAFLIYVCCLLEIGERNEAERVLTKYIDNIGCFLIWKYMPAARLFVEMGYKDHSTEKSAYIFDILEHNRFSNTLEKLLTGKTIAVIGNGPSEVGKNRGEEIDAHDIVIRINNYRLNGYEEDYGKRTDIWVRNTHHLTKDKDCIEDLSYIIWEADHWHTHVLFNHLDLLYRDVVVAGDKVGYMYGLRREVCTNSSVINPTTGLQLVYFLEKNRSLFKKLDYYGFSFMDPSSDASYSHYYDEPTSAKTDHQPSVEINYMRELVFGKRPAESERPKNQYYKIYACAFRAYDVNKGATGGPGGVLAMQRTIFGDEYKSCPVQYLFLPSQITYPPDVTEQIDSVSGRFKSVVQGAYFIQSHPEIKKDLENHITPVLLCHDMGTAYGAFLSGLKYCIVYHQQGGLLNEMTSAGGTPSEEDIKLINKVEKRTLEHAVSVYFPSMGAKQVLINTSETVAASDKIPFADHALYNTIPEVENRDNNNALLKQFGIPDIDKNASEIFFSCGDFNYDKGMERVPAFLTEYAKHSNKKVVWIGIGNASSREIFDKLNEEKDSWPFESYLFGKRTDHDTLLALMEFCDYYIMLHRNSIFDLATLEAMRAGARLILSPIGGNIEFNAENNVVFVEDENYSGAIEEVCRRDKKEWSESNIYAFNMHFSKKKFEGNYKGALDHLLSSAGFVRNTKRISSDNSDDV